MSVDGDGKQVEDGLYLVRMSSVAYADEMAKEIDRLLAQTTDKAERDRLLDWRNWHYANTSPPRGDDVKGPF